MNARPVKHARTDGGRTPARGAGEPPGIMTELHGTQRPGRATGRCAVRPGTGCRRWWNATLVVSPPLPSTAGTAGARTLAAAGLAVAVLLLAVQPVAARTMVSRSAVVAFQAAGDVGGGVLAPGSTYPPTTHGFATLQRGSDWVQANIATSNLPPGAYTVWWVIFDMPEGCSDPCSEDDLFDPDADVSVFLATGGVVPSSGDASFRAHYRLGDDLGEPGTQHLLGDGMIDTARAEIHNVIKYHGPASDDPAVLEEQVSTLLGSCSEGANAVDLGEPFGVQCFDPQAVVHSAPETVQQQPQAAVMRGAALHERARARAKDLPRTRPRTPSGGPGDVAGTRRAGPTSRRTPWVTPSPRVVATVFGVVVGVHWLEHVLQALQIHVHGLPPPQALGALGWVLPDLVHSEWLHLVYNTAVLSGLVVLAARFAGRSRTWWLLALAAQSWHVFEHLLLFAQAQTGARFFGTTEPSSILQLFVARADLHLAYNSVVTLLMVVAVVAQRRTRAGGTSASRRRRTGAGADAAPAGPGAARRASTV